jgi:hypothetical protein
MAERQLTRSIADGQLYVLDVVGTPRPGRRSASQVH